MPLLKRVRVLGAKLETTVGTEESLSGTDCVFHVHDVEIQANITTSDRANTGSFGSLAAPQEARMGTVTFKINPYGDGAGGVPTWASTFLPACGLVDAGGTFSPVAQQPGSGGVKTITLGVFENGLYKQLYGATGTMTLTAETAKQAELSFTFTGCWSDPTDSALPSVTYPTQIPYRSTGSSTPFSWGTFQGCINSFGFDLGNNNIMRQCTTNDSGYISGMITDRQPTATFNPESQLVATYDIFGDWKGATERAMTYQLEDADGSLTFNLTKSQITDIQESDRDGIQIDDVSVRVNEDDLTIVFA